MQSEHKFILVKDDKGNGYDSGIFEFYDSDVVFVRMERGKLSDLAKKTLGLSHWKGQYFPAFLDALRKFCTDFDIVLVEGSLKPNGNAETFRTALDKHEAGRLLLKHGVSEGRQGKAL